MENVDYEQLALEAEAKGGTGEPSWTGIVDGYTIKSASIDDNGRGAIEFYQPDNEKGFPIKLTVFPVDPENVQVYAGKTKEQTVTNMIVKENRLLKQLARQFAPSDVVDVNFAAARGLDAKIAALNTCLPDDTSTVTGRLVLGYKGKYLSIPNNLEWSDDDKQFLPFFSTDPNQKMRSLPNGFTRSKPKEEAVVASEEVDY